MSRTVVQLIHWKPAEAVARVKQLEAAGYRVRYVPPDPQGAMKHLREPGLDAIVIDLTRMPSHGREVGRGCRRSPSLRHIPLIFVEGDPAKVEAIRELLPDAVYTSWAKIRSGLRMAMARAVEDPVRPPDGVFARPGRPLGVKLGIKAGMEVALWRAPEDFVLEDLPEGARVEERITARAGLVIWFVRSHRELEEGLEWLGPRLRSPLWIAWPKQSSGLAPDLSFPGIRRLTRAQGLRESKICAIQGEWSGVRLTPPK